MDKLTQSQRDTLTKMATDRLRAKLAKAGFEESQLSTMARESMLDACANLSLKEQELTAPAAVAAAATAVPTIGYDVELEKKRLEFEMMKFQEEMALKREKLIREAEKQEREEQRQLEKREREVKEQEERLALYKLQEQELYMKQTQWEWQKSHDTRERERQQTPAAQVKFFGNVLKNVMPKFPTDVADIPIFFEGIDNLFDSFEVPEALQAKLLLPYLSDRAKSLLLRLEHTKQEKYDDVKAFLLNELKLTPVQFKERFDRAVRNRDETCTMFCSRLKNLLTYYCNSRKVEENFKSLFSLLVADKIKSTLTESCLDHVLTAEGNSWLNCDDLANIVDVYFANHTADGRPKMIRPDFRSRGQVAENVARKPNNGNFVSDGRANAKAGAISSVNSPREVKVANGGNGNQPASKPGLCFICNSPSHKRANCPMRSNVSQGETRGDVRASRNFACSVDPRVSEVKASNAASQMNDSGKLQCNNDGRQSLSDGARANEQHASMCNTDCKQVLSNTPVSKSSVQPAETAKVPSQTYYRSARATVSSAVRDTNLIFSHRQADLCSNGIITEGLSKLHYLPVSIRGINGIQQALNDSGSEINLIERTLIDHITQLPSQGRVKIKGIVGPAVETDIVLLDVSPVALEADCRNIAPPLREIFAVCDDLNEQIILTADTVNRLSALRSYESVVVPENIASSVDVVNVNNDGVVPTTHGTENATNSDNTTNPITQTETHFEIDSRSADTATLINEQMNDPTLSKYYDLIQQGNKQFFVRDGILFRHGKVNGNTCEQLCLPQKRVETVLKLAHDLPASGHQAVRRTNDRIAMSFFFPGQWQRVKAYCDSCEICQMRARERRTDLVPIKPIPRHEETFGHLQGDLIGPMGSGPYKYALVLTDIQTRYVTAFELTAPSAKNVVDKILYHSSFFGLPNFISFDCGTHFTSELTRSCLERLGVSPRFHCPYNPRAAGIVERSNSTVKQIISKLAADHPMSWHKLLPFALWSLRTSVNETLGISPYQAVFGKIAIGPLQLVCDEWIGKRSLPLDLAKAPCEYLQELERRLKIASDYASEHAVREQDRYTHAYNLRSRDKSFQVGERVIYLMPSSTHKMTRTWQGPAIVVQKNSPYSYIVELNGKRQWCHANNLRKYNERVNEVTNHNCAIIFDNDRDFGIVPTVQCCEQNECDKREQHEILSQQNTNHALNVVEVEDDGLSDVTMVSSILYDDAIDSVDVDPSTSACLPSEKIDRSKLDHLSDSQRRELMILLDEFKECFSEFPGFCPYVEHSVTVNADFKPKRLREYRIPEVLKPEIQRQIDELLKNGFIRPSNSPMASPIVAVLKGPSGKGGVRLAIDFRFVNLYTTGDAFVMPHLLDSIQKVGAARYISVFDARSGYWQLGVKEDCKWLTAFAYEGGFYEWNRVPFGMKSSGNTFCRCVQIIIQPIRHFCYPFVDDFAVCSDSWAQHLLHLRSFFCEIRKSGLTLSFNKCSLAQSEVRFVGHIVGSGRHRPDEDKLASISDLAKPTTKKHVRKMIGFFNYFHTYVPKLAELCVPFTNLLAKNKPNIVVWTDVEEAAFHRLTDALRDCVKANLYTAKWGKPFGIHCDSSKIAVGSYLMQWDDDMNEKPIAFASTKLSGAQLAWAAIEKEAYAIVWSLNKFRTWIFGAPITIFADSNPLTYLTASAPKSAKLTRWASALQEFDITFKYTKGRDHVVPDYLSRPN